MKAMTLLLALSSFLALASAEASSTLSCRFKDNKFGDAYLDIQEVDSSDVKEAMHESSLKTAALNQGEEFTLTRKSTETHELEDGVKISYTAKSTEAKQLYTIDLEVKLVTSSYQNCYGPYGAPSNGCSTVSLRNYNGYVKIESKTAKYRYMGLVECHWFFSRY